ncbi:beta-1,3-galactosyltransferase 2-like [Hyla sarda]|uniref:beta-1,3-galactosyltransferase 2-like n=1 Tax=Hyla sarda TaxID=327740 RepID=UPI0024C305E6|nr:beta-1,3-galactosyltransferase 2-like [Hyla sarda]
MIPFKRSKFPKLTIIQKLCLFFILLTPVLLILSKSLWILLFLVRSVSNLHVVPNFSWKLQEYNPVKVNDYYMEKSQNDSKNPMTKISNNLYNTLHIYDYIINEPDKCKENVPFLVLLITVERWQQEVRQVIRNTWAKEDLLPGVRILRLFFLGKEMKPNTEAQQDILQESEEFHDIIQQDYLDSYKNLTIKTIMAMNWITTYCPNALYVMKIDSDVFVNIGYLVNKLLKPDQEPKTNYITGFLMLNNLPIRDRDSKWYVSPNLYPYKKYPPFCSGTGYVLSGDLARKIVKISPSVRWIHLEDVFIGLCLDKLGVQPVAPPKTSDFNIWYVEYSDCEFHNIVTSHYASLGMLQHYWDRLERTKHLCA